MDVVKPFSWNQEKNESLKDERGISLEEVLFSHGAGRPPGDPGAHQPRTVRSPDGFCRWHRQLRLPRAIRRRRGACLLEDHYAEPKGHTEIPWKRGIPQMKPDATEKELLRSFDRGEWKPLRNEAAQKKRFARYA